MLASINFSVVFDVVDVKLQIIGLPDDLITLVEKWLATSYLFVNVNGYNSFNKFSKFGSVQGSILGPILYHQYYTCRRRQNWLITTMHHNKELCTLKRTFTGNNNKMVM
jgi:hypothetical protein